MSSRIDTQITLKLEDRGINRTVTLPYVVDPSVAACYDNIHDEYRFCIGTLDTPLDITQPIYHITSLLPPEGIEMFDQVVIKSYGYNVRLHEAVISMIRNAHGIFLEIAARKEDVRQKELI